jgi:hypothetical protein
VTVVQAAEPGAQVVALTNAPPTGLVDPPAVVVTVPVIAGSGAGLNQWVSIWAALSAVG